jgi:hypothetical protein
MFRKHEQTTRPGHVSARIFQLRAHRFVRTYYQLHRLFSALSTESGAGTDDTFAIMSETALSTLDRVDDVLFELNALSEGGEIDSFYMLDQLRSRISGCLDLADRESAAEQILANTVAISRNPDLTTELGVADCNTAHDMLLYCAQHLFALIDHRFRTAAGKATEPDLSNALLLIPVDNEPGTPPTSVYRIGTQYDLVDSPVSRVAETLLSAVNAFYELALSDPAPRQDDIHRGCTGMLCYSTGSLSLYHQSSRYTCIGTINIGDSASGNYLRLLARPTAPTRSERHTDEMFRRLLRWVDFDTYSSGQITVAAVETVIRETLEQHIGMLGKLLCFLAHPDTDCRSEAETLRRIELFLEQVV